MNYHNLPKEVLDIELGESYENGPYTLKDELDLIDEDLIYSFYETISYADGELNIKRFMAWTDKNVLVLIDGGLGDQVVIAIPRNPPNK